ncbi:MAG: ribbon-helix-helix protein, CopG family [Candidatus Methylomirabilales bacterium]
MVRTQIQLPEDQYRRLRQWARRLGISLSEAVRRCLADRLSLEESAPPHRDRVRSALAVCGRYADPEGPSRVAMDHDRHLAEAYRR